MFAMAQPRAAVRTGVDGILSTPFKRADNSD